MPAGIDTVFCWKGSWQELEATEADIAGWGTVIAQAADRGIRIINLYGGYLSVLLGAARLGGVNHGIGYSESRDVARLSETGAPPTRYYLPALRRFVSRAQAQPLIDLLPAGWRCPCAVCQAHGAGDAPPVLDNYSAEDLKRHFLLCRAAEIARVAADVQVELADLDSKAAWLGANPLPGGLARNFAAPLRTWSSGMRRLI